MGGDNSVPQGTNFAANEGKRKGNRVEEFPDIPVAKLREVIKEIEMQVKKSVFIVNYKKEYRDALKRKKAKGHDGDHRRLHDKSMEPADKASGAGNTLIVLKRGVCDQIYEVVKVEVGKSFKDADPTATPDAIEKSTRGAVNGLVGQKVEENVNAIGQAIFAKEKRGLNYEESDEELDEEALAKKKAEQDERKRKAAEDRDKQAASWAADKEKSKQEAQAWAEADAAKKKDEEARAAALKGK